MNRSLLVAMIVLTVLYGCGQASNPVERVEKLHGLDKQARGQQMTELAPEPPTSEPTASEKQMIEMACKDWDSKVRGPPPAFCYPAGLSPAFCHSASSPAFCQ